MVTCGMLVHVNKQKSIIALILNNKAHSANIAFYFWKPIDRINYNFLFNNHAWGICACSIIDTLS